MKDFAKYIHPIDIEFSIRLIVRMFFLRKLSSTPSRLIGQAIRWNATLTSIPQSSLPPSSSESAPTEPDKTKGRRRKKIPPKRPNISLANQRVWNKPLGLGTVPAYDLALQEISTDSDNLKAQLGVLRAEIEEKETGYNVLEKEITALPEEERLRREEELDLLDDEIERMMKKANIVEIQSEVNIPEVRWNVNNAMGMFLLVLWYWDDTEFSMKRTCRSYPIDTWLNRNGEKMVTSICW